MACPTTLYSYVVETFPSISTIFQERQGIVSLSAAEEKEKNQMMKNLQLTSNIDSRDSKHFSWIKMKTTYILNRYRVAIGTHEQHQCSLTKVKSMLSLIPPPLSSPHKNTQDEDNIHNCMVSQANPSHQTTELSHRNTKEQTTPRTSTIHTTYQGTDSNKSNIFASRYYLPQNKITSCNISDTQTASRLAEGTIYCLRDLLLDEAIELNFALQFWTERWEKPSWLEAGPTVWLSKEGYNHKKIGQRVSEIQALLAQRCASVGELQQHLWRAGWQRGVAEWGIIGDGWKWATLVGGNKWILDNDILQPVVGSVDDTAVVASQNNTSALEDDPIKDSMLLNNSFSDVSSALYRSASHGNNTEIVSNEPALAEWTIDAVHMVRSQLYEQQGDAHHLLPYDENWNRESTDSERLPMWALDVERQFSTNSFDEKKEQPKVLRRQSSTPTKLRISNLPLMAAEIKDLLSIIESQAAEQREHRVRVICPPSKLSRNWYIICGSLPIVGFVSYKFLKDGWGARLCKQIFLNIKEFYVEHVAEPVMYVYKQIFSTRGGAELSAADQRARLQAIESLKKMLQDWVDQTFPNMNPRDRRQIAETMDMSLIEKKKEESVKNALYEISDIVRMSLIEMQFVKKELMNAMVSMDELMQSNEFNFKLAAMTPAFILFYGMNRLCRYLFYSLLSLGKSREQVHESVRLAVLDIERLLVMRDCPPSVPPPKYKSPAPTRSSSDVLVTTDEVDFGKCHALVADRDRHENVLISVDLGMLLLLVHECRTTMLKNSRRFTLQEIRSFAEDMAELSGERGPVSVKQQLSIISRMFRTYSFLKVVSSGVTFNVTRYNI